MLSMRGQNFQKTLCQPVLISAVNQNNQTRIIERYKRRGRESFPMRFLGTLIITFTLHG